VSPLAAGKSGTVTWSSVLRHAFGSSMHRLREQSGKQRFARSWKLAADDSALRSLPLMRSWRESALTIGVSPSNSLLPVDRCSFQRGNWADDGAIL
jgi:hypothetical protein